MAWLYPGPLDRTFTQVQRPTYGIEPDHHKATDQALKEPLTVQ